MYLPSDPVTPLLGIFATEMKEYVHTHVFRAALLVRTKTVDGQVSTCYGILLSNGKEWIVDTKQQHE